MNAAKQEIIDAVSKMPDDLNKQELFNRLYIDLRLEQSREDYRKNGGIPNDEVRRKMREKHSAMIEGANDS